ncbi:hypothetical protein BDV19DRAFT_351806 [Aspergillus venezuelensis]
MRSHQTTSLFLFSIHFFSTQTLPGFVRVRIGVFLTELKWVCLSAFQGRLHIYSFCVRGTYLSGLSTHDVFCSGVSCFLFLGCCVGLLYTWRG